MSRMLTRCCVSPQAQTAVLLFIATTPAFLFIFTTYNNDSLATVLSIALLVIAYEWMGQGKGWRLLLLGVLATAGLYTKLNAAYPVSTLAVVLIGMGLAGKMPWRRILPAFGALMVGVLLLMPWLIGHNYRLTGLLIPVPADFPLSSEIRLPQSPLRTLLTPPGWSRGEWKDPYVHVWESAHHKKSSYLAFLFDSSIFGEYTFEFLPSAIPWAILLLHACLLTAAFLRANRSPYGVGSMSFICLGALFSATLFFRAPYAVLMNFRYVSWLWLPGAVLYGTVLASSAPGARLFSSSSVFRAMMLSGAILQGSLWLALLMGGRWNFPW